MGLLVLLALAGWAAWHERAALGALISRVTEYVRGPTLPDRFASGNGRIEATEYDVATKRAGRLATVLVMEGAWWSPARWSPGWRRRIWRRISATPRPS